MNNVVLPSRALHLFPSTDVSFHLCFLSVSFAAIVPPRSLAHFLGSLKEKFSDFLSRNILRQGKGMERLEGGSKVAKNYVPFFSHCQARIEIGRLLVAGCVLLSQIFIFVCANPLTKYSCYFSDLSVYIFL